MSFMDVALEMAKEALKVGEVPVGCVFVYNNTILGTGRNRTNEKTNATRHAEIEAIDEILKTNHYSIFKETTLYVTIEPCIMCASALREMNIKKVVFGARNDKFGGNGTVMKIHENSFFDNITNDGYIVEQDVEYKEDSIMLLRQFYVQENTHAPNPRDKKKRKLKEFVE